MKVSKQMARDLQGTEEGMSEFEGSTPGPWQVGATNPNPDEPDEIAVLADIPDTAPLCVAVAIPTGMGRDMEPERTRANARLIAAAPDLLAERDALAARVAELEAHLGRALEYWAGHFTSRYDALVSQDQHTEGSDFRHTRALIQEEKP